MLAGISRFGAERQPIVPSPFAGRVARSAGWGVRYDQTTEQIPTPPLTPPRQGEGNPDRRHRSTCGQLSMCGAMPWTAAVLRDDVVTSSRRGHDGAFREW